MTRADTSGQAKAGDHAEERPEDDAKMPQTRPIQPMVTVTSLKMVAASCDQYSLAQTNDGASPDDPRDHLSARNSAFGDERACRHRDESQERRSV